MLSVHEGIWSIKAAVRVEIVNEKIEKAVQLVAGDAHLTNELVSIVTPECSEQLSACGEMECFTVACKLPPELEALGVRE